MHIFILLQYEEASSGCILLSGNEAGEFIRDPNKFVQNNYGDGSALINSWIVPSELKNSSGSSDSIHEEFDTLLALDTIGEFPVISDLYATIFEAGFRLAENSNKEE